MIPLLVLATVLAGMLGPMQSAVNGQVGKLLGDGNASAVVSFGSGLVVMAIIILARRSTREQFAAIPRKMKAHRLPWWNWFAGCCGAVIVFFRRGNSFDSWCGNFPNHVNFWDGNFRFDL
ncbi:DMT family transporter [Secundilactobacillus odoratitofui]|uniref:DMT family transporter n=1 Tax=Secundilactobacillus odoratitofui TaxID=480930 RepID=UPI000AB6858C|nr:DMT family transporter [Secundilactobacillus odoratitofui]